MLEGIESVLETKFGRSGKKLARPIRQVADTDKLRALLHALKTAATLDEVKQLLAQLT